MKQSKLSAALLYVPAYSGRKSERTIRHGPDYRIGQGRQRSGNSARQGDAEEPTNRSDSRHYY